MPKRLIQSHAARNGFYMPNDAPPIIGKDTLLHFQTARELQAYISKAIPPVTQTLGLTDSAPIVGGVAVLVIVALGSCLVWRIRRAEQDIRAFWTLLVQD